MTLIIDQRTHRGESHISKQYDWKGEIPRKGDYVTGVDAEGNDLWGIVELVIFDLDTNIIRLVTK